jgi:prepilin-type N-terminal cleavage/methylation domain-containing protein/prepilin-type processing-associated H-X9-DG protein
MLGNDLYLDLEIEELYMRDGQRRKGFTLVELLVVIGIIALLISILLPSLNRARQQANLLVCSSNLRNIGQLLQEYAAENGGYTPACWSETYYTTYADTLSVMVTRQYLSALTPNAAFPNQPTASNQFEPPQDLNVFHDVDVSNNLWAPHSCAYVANPRAFGAVDKAKLFWDPLTANVKGYNPRKLATIRHSSDVMTVWCGACNISSVLNYGCFYTFANGLDGYQMTGGHGLCYPSPAQSTFPVTSYANLISLGGQNPLGGAAPNSKTGGVTLSYLKLENMDFISNSGSTNYSGFGGYDVCYMRFRHINNTTCNFLFADGHVASRPIGTVVASDICMNPGTPP